VTKKAITPVMAFFMASVDAKFPVLDVIQRKFTLRGDF
jgi:hypothetical protein